MGRYSDSSDSLREVMTKRQKELDKKLKKKVDSLMERHGVNKEFY